MGLGEKVTHRNNIIPTSVLVAAVLPPAHGVLFALQQIYIILQLFFPTVIKKKILHK